MKIAGCVIASWSRVQGTVACSSAEAEYFSICTGAAEALFAHLLASELGISSHHVPPCILTDASAAKAMAERTGLPTRAKRIEIRYLHVQQLNRSGRIKLVKIGAKVNIANLLTKFVERVAPQLGRWAH